MDWFEALYTYVEDCPVTANGGDLPDKMTIN